MTAKNPSSMDDVCATEHPMTLKNPSSVVDDILARVLPVLREHPGEGEHLRRLPEASAEALIEAACIPGLGAQGARWARGRVSLFAGLELQSAIVQAEDWLRQKRPRAVSCVNRDAKWRSDPMTPAQRAVDHATEPADGYQQHQQGTGEHDHLPLL